MRDLRDLHRYIYIYIYGRRLPARHGAAPPPACGSTAPPAPAPRSPPPPDRPGPARPGPARPAHIDPVHIDSARPDPLGSGPACDCAHVQFDFNLINDNEYKDSYGAKYIQSDIKNNVFRLFYINMI
jgi:hypothetical protein